MIVLAVLLLVLVAAVVVFVVVAGAGEPVLMTWEALNLRWEPTALLVFAAGAVTVVVLGAALALLRSGARRSGDKRRELKRLRRAEQEGALATPGRASGSPEARASAPQSPHPREHGSSAAGDAARRDRGAGARSDDAARTGDPARPGDEKGRRDDPGAART